MCYAVLCAMHHADYITPPFNDRDKIIYKAHFLGHFDVIAVEATIHNNYKMHWTNTRRDIHRIISNCDPCSHYNIAKVGYHSLRNFIPTLPLVHWSIDLANFNHRSVSGNMFLLVLLKMLLMLISMTAPKPRKTFPSDKESIYYDAKSRPEIISNPFLFCPNSANYMVSLYLFYNLLINIFEKI